MYSFPYHHVVQFDPDDHGSFCQYHNNAGGYRYASYLIRTIQEVARHEFQSLIDIGCGDGYFLKKLAGRHPAKKLVGVDLSEPAIAFARLLTADVAGPGGNVEFICRDIVADPPSRHFDIATSVAVLEHIPPQALDGFLGATRDLLRPGGTFIVVLPTHNLPIRNIKRHYQHFDERSATTMLQPFFEVASIEYLNNDRPWGGLIGKLLTNGLFILNNRRLREWLFEYYMRHFLHSSREKGYMMMIVCKRR